MTAHLELTKPKPVRLTIEDYLLPDRSGAIVAATLPDLAVATDGLA